MFSTVVVGADGSETAKRAVEAAAEIAKLYNSQLHIVSAYESKPSPGGDRPAEFRHLGSEGEVDALLQDLSFIARRHDVNATLHGAKGDPAEVIIGVAEKVDADLVVVGNRGMKGVRRVLGSVPNTVAHGAPCSVLIVDTTE
jgi:nucleotide-binding universal stress UspA family protein